AVVNHASRPQLQVRLGNGSKGVRLYSQAGNITLANATAESLGVAATTPSSSSSPNERRETLEPKAVPTPKQKPELTGPPQRSSGAGTPAPVSNEPEEISEATSFASTPNS